MNILILIHYFEKVSFVKSLIFSELKQVIFMRDREAREILNWINLRKKDKLSRHYDA